MKINNVEIPTLKITDRQGHSSVALSLISGHQALPESHHWDRKNRRPFECEYWGQRVQWTVGINLNTGFYRGDRYSGTVDTKREGI